MTELVTSDLQFSPHPRDEYRHLFVEQLLKLVDKHKVDTLYVLGDITEEKDFHSAALVNRVVSHLYRLSQKCELIILRGNHDYLDIEDPFFQFMSLFDNIRWIDRPTSRGADFFLPHTRDHQRDWKDLPLRKNYRFIFTHNIFTGTRASSGMALKGIPTSVFAQDASVISGDVHEPQEVDCVTYVGSPYLCDFGDDYEPRVLLIDNDDRVRSIPVDGPQKRLLEWTWPLPEKTRFKAKDGDIVKIRVFLTSKQSATWAAIHEEAKQIAANQGWVIDHIQPIVETVSQPQVRESRAPKTDVELLHEYAARRGLEDRLVKFGEGLLEDESDI